MEISLLKQAPCSTTSLTPPSKTTPSFLSTPFLPTHHHYQHKTIAIKAHHGSSRKSSEEDSKLKFEKNKHVSDFDGELMIKSEKSKHKERKLVEALEGLEEEAIMGDDQGIEATDYNRRAHIFDTCSKVFQGLKHEA